jgi:hypothetical protein
MAERRRSQGRSSSSGSKGSRGGGRSKTSGSSRSKSSGTSRGKSTSSRSKAPPARSKASSSRSKAPSSRSRTSSSRAKSDADKPVRGTAPSAADIDKLEKFEPSEEAKRHEPSTVDAMGQDKRREVVGHSYGPSKRSQIMFFVAVGAVVVVIVGGWLALVSAFDNPPTEFKDSAPWSTKPTSAALAAQQSAKPVSPANPCGEPGNPYPVPPESPCAAPSKANGNQGNSAGQ